MTIERQGNGSMWTRVELKGRSKEVLRRCLMPAIIVCLIAALLAGGYGNGTGSGSSQDKNMIQEDMPANYAEYAQDALTNAGRNLGIQIAGIVTGGIASAFMLMGVAIFLLSTFLSLLIGAPIAVGEKRFFMRCRTEKAQIGEILYAFRSGYVFHVIFVMFLKSLKTFLWSLLFVIPGIVKSYEYRMVPYILSENPQMDSTRVFEMSRRMMDGQKWNAFILDLSFLPWAILAAFTCGLLDVLYLRPYMAATYAELYSIFREEAIHSGQTNTYELPGFEETQQNG